MSTSAEYNEAATRINRQTRFVNELYMGHSRRTLISDNSVEERLSVSINNSELCRTLIPLIKSYRKIGVYIYLINYI